VSRARLAAPLLVLALSPLGCTSVLGLDPPTLAPCLDGGCPDAPMRDAATDAADAGATESSCETDAAGDVAPPPGVKCGGGCFGVTYCTSPTPVCCQETSDAGITTYACTASESTCSGYPIVCANDDDCPGSDICCHFMTKMTCDTTAACPSQDLVCRPGVPLDCMANQMCDKPAVNDGVTSPYSVCEP
jgi:hypothetical protein